MSPEYSSHIAENLTQVERRTEEECMQAVRERSEVTLVAVSKTRSIAAIVEAYREGVRNFGENRVEEAAEKVPQLRRDFADDPVTWHMIIGPVSPQVRGGK